MVIFKSTLVRKDSILGRKHGNAYLSQFFRGVRLLILFRIVTVALSFMISKGTGMLGDGLSSR